MAAISVRRQCIKLQVNSLMQGFNRNLNIFIQENAFEWRPFCEMAAILFRPQCVKLPVFIARHHVCRPILLLLHSCILTMVFGLDQLLHCLWLEKWSSTLRPFPKTVFEMDKIIAPMPQWCLKSRVLQFRAESGLSDLSIKTSVTGYAQSHHRPWQTK